ncbi:NADAR family protein [Kitasatospora sp. NPDC048540]|uniref:NADAR family protein n=1 Tax=unclassified Kitasatospora TaxID=2633591 RepID=UPI0009E71768|nr:NADAR family protein [Kitasatospora sp. MBT63]
MTSVPPAGQVSPATHDSPTGPAGPSGPLSPVDTRTREELAALVEAGARPKYLLFWGHRPERDGRIGAGALSQWWPARFTVDGVGYPTAEHWMMAGKARLFGDEEIVPRILAARTPGEAKKLGRQVRGFHDERWAAERFELVVRGNVAKFGSSEELRGYLLGTGGRVLVEASPLDRLWGIGLAADDERATAPARWRGLNLLGFALMEARARLAV